MSSFKRIAAGASALLLASGAALVGAGAAGAQGSSEIAADLELAAAALNGPVQVSGNAEGGPTVTYTNDNEGEDRCVGFTMPYSTVAGLGINPGDVGGGELGDTLATVALIGAEGGTASLTSGAEGEPVSVATTDLGAIFYGWVLAGQGVVVQPGESIVWEAAAPTDEPAAAVVACDPYDSETLDDIVINFGIDPQVVADQINDRLGPLGSIGAGSVSGGSVGMGASLLGSLGDDDDSQPEESDGSSMMSSGVSEAGSGNDDEDGELPAATLVN